MVRGRTAWSALAATLALAGTLHAQVPADNSPPTGPLSALSNSAETLRDSIVAMARAQVGTRYVLGGAAPSKGFDCSGLVRYIMSALQVDVPRTAAQQATVGSTVERDVSRLRPGDLVTFGRGRRVDHIGVYVGDGRFVHASTKAGKVVESQLIRPKYAGIKPWKGVRRLFTDADSTPPKKGAG